MSEAQTMLEKEQEYVCSAVTRAYATYLSDNPISAKSNDDATKYMPGGNTRTSLHVQPFPLCIKAGAGKTLTSADGRTYIDFLGEYSAGLFGHSNARIRDALTEVMKSGWNYGGQTFYEKKLARDITTRFGKGGLEMVRFTNSGTEANTMAIGAAIAWTGRKKILIFSSGYHGGTLIFTMDICKWSHSKNSTTAPININLPHDFVMAPFNNIKETKAIVEGLPKDSLAAILIEPVQGSSGCRPALPAFLTYLRETCDQLGALFIVDEVMTSRLGPSGYIETLGLKADFMTIGKWIGGGMSFGAFGGRREIMEMFDPSRSTKGLPHAGTFNNNVFTMAAGAVALNIYNKQKVEEFNARGDRMKRGITKVLFETGIYSQEDTEYLKDIREIDSFEEDVRLYAGYEKTLHLPRVLISGRGTMLNLRFTGSHASSWHSIYYHFMLQNGVYLASRGYTPMNLEISDEDVDLFVGLVMEFLTIHLDALKS
jgi:glutamate-1-semialdehyde 2,1-aminomutase